MRPLRLSQTADAGLRFAGVNAGVRVGAIEVRTLTVWDRMHALDAKAQSLDKNIQAYVREPNLKQRYNEWYTVWRSLYDALAAPNQARPDLSQSRQAELTSLVGDHEREFESLLQAYNQVGQQAGAPAVTYAPIVVASSAAPAKTGLPWWFWVAGGVAIFGVGYVVYRKYQEGKAKAAYIHKEAPGLLERYLPGYGQKAYGYTQAGRDPDASEGASPEESAAFSRVGSKIPPQHDPLKLDYYATQRTSPERDPEPARPEPEENLGTYELEDDSFSEPAYTPYRHRGYSGFGHRRGSPFGYGRGAPFGRIPGYLGSDDEEIY